MLFQNGRASMGKINGTTQMRKDKFNGANLFLVQGFYEKGEANSAKDNKKSVSDLF